MHHLHIAQSGPHWPLPSRRCALAPPSARVGAHGTRIRGGRSAHNQLRGHGARRRSRCAAARRRAEMDVVFLSESRHAGMCTPGSLLMLHWPGWVMERAWRWLRAIPPFAGRAPGLCDVGSRHGRRAPLERPGCVGASGAARAGCILRLLADSDARSSAPCGRWHETVAGQSLRPPRRAVRRLRGWRASGGLARISPVWRLAPSGRCRVLALLVSSCAAEREGPALQEGI